MRAFAQKQDRPRPAVGSSLARPDAASRTHRVDHDPARPSEPAAGGHDFARMRVHSGVAAAPGELDQPPLRIGARPPAGLPAATPAWTANGEISVGPAGLFLAPEVQRRMLRHEAFHRLHQRIAPVSDAAEARAGAERLASKAESGFAGGGLLVPAAPAPALLAFPPQTHAPWDQVYIGHSHVIGEVVEGGVAARILLSYKDIGITSANEPQSYHCGRHPSKPASKLAARMRKAAKLAGDLNGKTPAGFTLKTAVVAISSGANSSFREAGGKGVIVVKQEEPWEGIIAHEGSHGIFSFHLGEGTKAGPDPFAKAIAGLFLELSTTRAVSMPTGPFDSKHPPPLRDDGKTSAKPAGLVMAMDILWAGKGSSPGHPWDSADEFFASAFGAFHHDRPLFEKIVKHYGAADPKLPALTRRLLALLATVGNQTAVAALAPPANTKAADAELKRIQPTPPIGVTDAATAQLVDPGTLPGPATIACPSARPPAKKPAPASGEAGK